MSINCVRGFLCVVGPGIPNHEFLVVSHGTKERLMEQMPSYILEKKNQLSNIRYKKSEVCIMSSTLSNITCEFTTITVLIQKRSKIQFQDSL